MRKFPTLSEAWEKYERADWMMCVLVHGHMLDKPTSLKLAAAFVERSPTRAGLRWVDRVAEAGGDLDAAGDAWAASYTSAFTVVYASSRDFDDRIFAVEMRWQADKIREIVGNPFQGR
jgi:hypothetical protein